MKVRQLIVVAAIVGAVASMAAAVAAARIEPGPGGSIPTAERLRGMLLAPNELPGYSALDCPRVVTTAAEWARSDSPTTAALRVEGFVMGLRESLTSGTWSSTADSEAVNFRSAAGARRDAVRQLVVARMMGLPRRFAVPGIPTGYGWALFTDGGMSYHVVFSAGKDEYGVALAVPPGAPLSASDGEAEVIAAAAGILARVS